MSTILAQRQIASGTATPGFVPTADASGFAVWASGSGGGGTPGGSDGQVQYNNGGVFGGFGLFNDGTNALSVPGTFTADGNIIAGDGDTAGSLISNDGAGGSVEQSSSISSASYQFIWKDGISDNDVFTFNDLGGNVFELLPVAPSTLATPPAGSNAEIQYNADGVFGAEAAFAYNSGTNILTLNGILAVTDGTDLFQITKTSISYENGTTFNAVWGVVTGGMEFILRDDAGIDVHIMNSGDSGGVQFNQGQEDIDFRVDGSGSTHLIFADAGNNRVGINNLTPGTPLDVVGTIRGDGLIESTGGDVHALGGTLLAGELNTTGQVDLVSGDGVSAANIVSIDAPSAVVTAWTLTLPPVVNTAVRQVMMANDTSGNTVWGFIEKFTQSLTSPVTMLLTTEVDMGADIAAEAGTIVEYGVRITTWTPDPGNPDTITVRLYVNGSVVDSFTSTAGVAGFLSSGAVIEAYSQDDYIEVKAEITTETVLPDMIQILCWIAKP